MKIKFVVCGAGLGIPDQEAPSPIPIRVKDKVSHYNSEKHQFFEVTKVGWTIDETNGEFWQEISVDESQD